MAWAGALWVKDCLDVQTQRVVGNRVTSIWWWITSGAPQGSVLGPVLLNIFLDDLDNGIESILSQFADDIELSGSVDLLQGRKDLQEHLDQWAEVLQDKVFLGHKNPMEHCRLRAECLERGPAETDLEVLDDSGWT